ncbi:MAG: hypothetical protein IRY85_19230 [Micromonosporaceae bacterium]|nr:hypothetical protein [Micromonosporaceae bacterium]
MAVTPTVMAASPQAGPAGWAPAEAVLVVVGWRRGVGIPAAPSTVGVTVGVGLGATVGNSSGRSTLACWTYSSPPRSRPPPGGGGGGGAGRWVGAAVVWLAVGVAVCPGVPVGPPVAVVVASPPPDAGPLGSPVVG